MSENGKETTPMEYRRLGGTGLKVSLLSFGAWVTFGNQVGVDEATALLKQCYEAGCNFFDNAEVYAGGKAEEVMGEAIERLGWKRSDYVVSTKIFWGGQGVNDKGLSRKHIVEGTKAALKRLRVEYVDLIFCHRPDNQTPIEETVRAMNFVIDQGWAFYWGTSEWSAEQLIEAWSIAQRLGLQGPAMEQPQYNMLERQKLEKEYLPLFEKYKMGTTIWSPLASGLLSGKYLGGKVPEGSRLALEMYKGLAEKKLVQENLAKVDALQKVAEKLGCKLAQLGLAWCAKNPNVSTVITGATKPEQVAENFQALEVLPKLTQEIMDEIDDIVKTKPDPAPTFR